MLYLLVNQICQTSGTMSKLSAKWLPDRDLVLPIVRIAKEEWTKEKFEQLASTIATSATVAALSVMERPGQHNPENQSELAKITWNGNSTSSQYK